MQVGAPRPRGSSPRVGHGAQERALCPPYDLGHKNCYILRLTVFMRCSMHTPALLIKGASGGSPVGGAGFGVLRLWLAPTGSGGTGSQLGHKDLRRELTLTLWPRRKCWGR